MSSPRCLAPLLLSVLLAAAASAGTLKVPSEAYPTIQSAVDAAVPGDVVLLKKGTYVESVSIASKSDLVIRGKKGATIDLGGAMGSAIDLVLSENVTVERLRIRGAGIAVDAALCEGLILEKLEIADGGVGILLFSCDDSIVRKCEVEDTLGVGVQCFSGARNRVEDNQLRGMPDGIVMDESEAVITGNRLEAIDEVGILCIGGAIVIEENQIDEVGGAGVQLGLGGRPVSGGVIRGNRITNTGTGILVENAAVALVLDNRLEDLASGGVEILDSQGVVVADNRIQRGGASALRVVGSVASVLSNRVLQAGQFGVQTEGDCAGSWLVDNVVKKSGGVGVRVGGDGLVLVGNRASKSGTFDLSDDGADTVLIDNDFESLDPAP